MALFRYFQKTEKTLNEHFKEVSNDESSNTGLSRVESESVAETLEAVKSGKYLTKLFFFLSLHVFFYKHTKIRKQAQRCLGRELNKAEKMLEGCLYPSKKIFNDAYKK